MNIAEIDGLLPLANGRVPAVLYDAAGNPVDVAALIAANASQRWLATAWRTTANLSGSGTAAVQTPNTFNIWTEGTDYPASVIALVVELEATVTATTANAVVSVDFYGLGQVPSAGNGITTGQTQTRRWRTGLGATWPGGLLAAQSNLFARLGIASASAGGSWATTLIRSRVLYLPI